MSFDMDKREVSFSVTVPGKIILMGEHSVLYKKLGLAASINKRLIVSFEEREDTDVIEINFKSLNLHKKWSFESVYEVISLNKPVLMGNENFSIGKPEFLSHKHFIDIIVNALGIEQENLTKAQKSAVVGAFYLITSMLWCVEIDIRPFYLEVDSELSVGAGTGSSAAFSVGLASALYEYIKLKATQKYGMHNPNISKHSFEPYFITTTDEIKSFSSEDKGVINKWAYCIEKIMHGTPSGLDNTVCTFGNAVQINAKESTENSNLEPIHDLPTLRVLLVNSNIPRNTSDMVQKVADMRKLCPIAVDAVLGAMDTVATEFLMLLQCLSRNVEQTETEVIYNQLQGLVDIQQGLLGTIGVSHPRLDEICMITKRRGFHSKLTGAGGGGYAFTLIPPHSDRSKVLQCIEDLKYSGFDVEDVEIFSEGLTLGKA